MDLTGRQFSHLTVLSRYLDYTPSKGQRQRQWLCSCACGETTVVRTGHLTSGAVKSCGCMRRKAKHGQSRTTLYRAWVSMRQRCENPKHPEFKNYGARGISVDPSWKDFQVFHAYVGGRPAEGLELDRIDNDKNYEPGNVRWATRAEQCANTRRTVVLEVEPGRLLPRDVAARLYGIPAATLRYRLSAGWDMHTALNAPPKYNFRKLGSLTR